MILPHVLAIRSLVEDQIVLDLALAADHPAFDGHFPGQPILPGVVQLDWALRLGALHFNLELKAAKDFQVKYRRIIQPNTELSLILWLKPAKTSLAFEYLHCQEIASTGRIRLEPSP